MRLAQTPGLKILAQLGEGLSKFEVLSLKAFEALDVEVGGGGDGR